jgi:hypothetical protein
MRPWCLIPLDTVHVATPNDASILKGAGGALVMAGVLRASAIRNIFAVGGSTDQDSPVVFKYVSGAQNLAAFVGNALVGGPVYLEGSGPPTLARTIPELEAALTSVSPNAGVGGNYRITTSCATDGGVDDSIGGICSALSCAARASGGCLGSLVQGGFGTDQGATALDAGWRLDPTAPCSLKTGGRDAGGAAFDDFFDASRTVPFRHRCRGNRRGGVPVSAPHWTSARVRFVLTARALAALSAAAPRDVPQDPLTVIDAGLRLVRAV